MISTKQNTGAESASAKPTSKIDDAADKISEPRDFKAAAERYVPADRIFTVTVGTGVKDTNTKPKNFTLELLLKYVTTHVATGENKEAKTGSPWIIGGSFGENPDGRNDFSMRGVDLVQYDFDGGEWTDEQLTTVMDASGYAYGLYSTWSHLEDGATHKYRVAIPLAQTFMSSGIGEDRELFARGYTALGKKLFGDTFDPVTKNLSRLFFVASAPGSRVALAVSRVAITDLQLFDFNALCASLPQEERKPKVKMTAANSAARKEFDEVWSVIHGSFNAADFARDLDETTKDRGDKVETFCPFNDEHGTPDEPGKTPVVWYNAEDAKHDTATVVCAHASCKETHKRTAGDFVFAVLDTGPIEALRDYITDDDVVRAFDALMEAREPTVAELKTLFDELDAMTKPMAAVEDAERVLEIARAHLVKVEDERQASRKALASAMSTKDRAAAAFAATVKPHMGGKKSAAQKRKDDAQFQKWKAKSAAQDVAVEALARANHAADAAQRACDTAAIDVSTAETAYAAAKAGAAHVDGAVDLKAGAVVRRISAMPEGIERDAAVKRLSELTGRAVTALTRLVKAEAGRLKVAKEAAKPKRVAHDLADNEVDWKGGFVERVARTKKILRAANSGDDPKLFYDLFGNVVRINQRGERPAVEVVTGADDWTVALTDQVRFVDDGGVTHDPLPDILKAFTGGNDAGLFQKLERLVTVPVFGKSGRLLTKPGYDADNKTILIAVDGLAFREVSAVPSDEEVTKALALLEEPCRDFPFSDNFDGDEKEPLRIAGDLDADGFPLPNKRRGRGSRANFKAMLLQPFVRNMIDGPCPAYHFSKAVNGTGANYLADVFAGIFEGTLKAPTMQASQDEERMKQEIAAAVRAQIAMLFFDNIRHKLQSGSLESMLGSGAITFRPLGTSANETRDVKGVVIIAGNGVEMSPDLKRRLCPIHLDAACERPGVDRGPGTAFEFKHDPLQNWIAENRTDLVWACHTIIQNWIARGKKPGRGKLASFDNWARVMSGIFEAANEHDFMANAAAYHDQAGDETQAYLAAMDAIYELLSKPPYVGKSMSATDLWEKAIADKMTGTHDAYDLNISGYTPAAAAAAFGRYLNSSGMVGTTRRYKGVGALFKIGRGAVDGRSAYRLVAVEDGVSAKKTWTFKAGLRERKRVRS